MEKSFSVKVAAPTGAVVVGLILALYQVQGWKMPAALAVLLLSILFGLLALSIGTLCFAAVKIIKQFIECRATSAAWVSAEVPGLLDYEADGERATKRFTIEL
jgi:xanthosine utilization system XapX-like protein